MQSRLEEKNGGGVRLGGRESPEGRAFAEQHLLQNKSRLKCSILK